MPEEAELYTSSGNGKDNAEANEHKNEDMGGYKSFYLGDQVCEH